MADPKEKDIEKKGNGKDFPEKHGKHKGFRKSKYKGSNDPKWWLNYPELARDAANIAFNVIHGTGVKLFDTPVTGNNLNFGLVTRAALAPTIGKCSSGADAFNTQIRQLWLDMHRKYRGIGTYEMADLGVALIAIKDAFSTLSKFERIYGVINSYKIRNRVLPYGLKEALGVDDSLEQNLADFRYTLNLYIKKMQQLCLPKDFSMVLSDVALFGDVFADADNDRAALFLFDSDVFGKYDAARFTSGGCVTYVKYAKWMTGVTKANVPAFTLSDIVKVLEDQLTPLLGDDDIARICSDLLAAYGSENVMVLGVVPEDYAIIPHEDEERLLQLHNLTRVGSVASSYRLDLEVQPNVTIDSTYIRDMNVNEMIEYVIYQIDNTVMCEMACGSSAGGAITYQQRLVPAANLATGWAKANDVILDFWKDEPSDGDILVATRFTSLAENAHVESTFDMQRLTAYGSQICTYVQTFYYDGALYYDIDMKKSVQAINALDIRAELVADQVDWRPITYVMDPNSNFFIGGDLDQFTIISTNTLFRLHEVCILSGYKVNATAKAE